MLGRIQQLACAEKVTAEVFVQEPFPVAAGAVHDQHGIAHRARGIALRLTDGPIMDPQIRERFAGGELEVLDRVTPLSRLREACCGKDPGE